MRTLVVRKKTYLHIFMGEVPTPLDYNIEIQVAGLDSRGGMGALEQTIYKALPRANSYVVLKDASMECLTKLCMLRVLHAVKQQYPYILGVQVKLGDEYYSVEAEFNMDEVAIDLPQGGV